MSSRSPGASSGRRSDKPLFTLEAGCRSVPPRQVLFRWTLPDAVYAPDSVHPSLGRFGDGSIPTLYLAASAEGAMAEYFRVNPSLLAHQAGLKLRLAAVDTEVVGELLDVIARDDALLVGISHDRLVSYEVDEAVRWVECQQLALAAVEANVVGILYPSAAWANGWNLVLFGGQGPGRWRSHGWQQMALPQVDPKLVLAIGR